MRFILGLLVLALVALSPIQASADHADKHITFAAPPAGWPPFVIPIARSNDATGIMPDILKVVSARLGYTVSMEFYPELRGRLLLSEGKIDAYAKSKKWVETPSDYLWTDPIVEVEDLVVSHTGAPVAFKRTEDLIGLSIGVVHGFSYPTLDHLFTRNSIHKHTANDTKNLLRMLERGYLDGVVTTRQVAEWILREDVDLDAWKFAFSKTTIDSAPYGFAFRKTPGLGEFIAQFNRELKAMREDGRLQTIFDKYR